jgi:hypothetical protein
MALPLSPDPLHRAGTQPDTSGAQVTLQRFLSTHVVIER